MNDLTKRERGRERNGSLLGKETADERNSDGTGLLDKVNAPPKAGVEWRGYEQGTV